MIKLLARVDSLQGQVLDLQVRSDRLQGLRLNLWDIYGLADYELGADSICEYPRGRWYLNVTVKVARKALPVAQHIKSLNTVGIHLGLKDLVDAQRFYRDLEPAL
jgi:putative transposase